MKRLLQGMAKGLTGNRVPCFKSKNITLSAMANKVATDGGEDAEINIISGEDEKQLPQYQEVWKRYSQKGAKVAVFWHSGKFFNFLGFEEEDGTPWNNFRDIVKDLDLKVTANRPREKLSMGNPLKAGVPVVTGDRWQQRALNAGYIVVIVMQSEEDKTKREVSTVITPATQMMDTDSPNGALPFFVVALYIENNQGHRSVRIDRLPLSIGMCAMDVTTGKVVVHEASSTPQYEAAALDEAYRFLKAMSAVEVVVLAKGFKKFSPQQTEAFCAHLKQYIGLDAYLIRSFDVDDDAISFMSASYQSEVCKRLYPKSSNQHGLEMYQLSCAALCLCANSIYEQRPCVLKGIAKPEVWADSQQLVLNHNTAEQLDILHRSRRKRTDSLFRLLDNTLTPMGSRLLHAWLLNPSTDCKAIQKRLDTVEALIRLPEELRRELKSHLQMLNFDLRRLIRRAEMPNPHQELGVQNFYNLYYGLLKVSDLLRFLGQLVTDEDNYKAIEVWFATFMENVGPALHKFLDAVESTFDLQVLQKIHQVPTNPKEAENQRIFLPRVVPEVDAVLAQAATSETDLQRISKQINAIFYPRGAGTMKKKGNIEEEKVPIKLKKEARGVHFCMSIDDTVLLKHYRDQIIIQRKENPNAAPKIQQYPGAKQFMDAHQIPYPSKTISKERQAKKVALLNASSSSKSAVAAKGKNSVGLGPGRVGKKPDQAANESEDESNSDEEPIRVVQATGHEKFKNVLQKGAAVLGAPPVVTTRSSSAVQYLSQEQIYLLSQMSLVELKESTKIMLPQTNHSYDNMQDVLIEIQKVVVEHFNLFVNNIVDKYQLMLEPILNFVATIDVLFSHARTASDRLYCKPTLIEDGESSTFEATDLRHPIAEELLRSRMEFIPNDVFLGDSVSSNGYMLFGLNNSGKTVLLKSVALAVIMAQSGSYVAAKTLKLRPFSNIITRLSGKDNMQSGQGTFAVEMSELRTILAMATPKTLVLGDEICHGTEYPSAVSIVAASIEEMVRLKTNFLFATHLHSLASMKRLMALPTVKFMHFGVQTRSRNVSGNSLETEIIYNRKLQPGSGPATYGIEVAAAQGIPDHVIRECHAIRRELLDEAQAIVDTRTSHFNSAVIMDRCCMPGCSEKAKETHHIEEQCTADENGIVAGRFHKNSGFNLVPLCKAHHDDVTFRRTLIKGWALMLNGQRTLIVEPILGATATTDPEAAAKSLSSTSASNCPKPKHPNYQELFARKK
jgi:DNA mismatch repair ATPase MutS